MDEEDENAGGVAQAQVKSEPGASVEPVKESTSEESTMISKSVVHMVDQWKIRGSNDPEARCSNAATAHTNNVVGREYLVRTNIPWSVARRQGEYLTELKLPSDIWTPELALTGLYEYHAYQHSDFIVRFKVNPSKFHAGKLLAVFIPDIIGPNESIASLTQYNHAFVDMQGETEAVLKVPYSYYYRMMHTNKNPFYGVVRLYVWNQLRTGTSQPSSLYVSAFVRPENPYIGVKGVKLTLENMDRLS